MSCSPPTTKTIPVSLLYLMLAQLSVRAALGQISNSPSVTSAPDSNIGFWMSGTLAHGTECSEGYTFATSRTFVNCCAVTDTSCNFITKCRSSYEVVWSHGANSVCSPGVTCSSAIVLDNYQDPQTRWSWIFCDTEGIENLTIYRNWERQQPGPAIITSTQDFVSSTGPLTSLVQISPPFTSAEISTGTSSSPKEGSTASVEPTSTAIEGASSSASPETGSNSSDGSKKAWIAAAVVGPVGALIGLGIFAFLWKRSRAKKLPGNTTPVDLTQYHEAPVEPPKNDGEVFELPGACSWSPVFELESRESRRAGDPTKAVELGLPSPVYEVE